MLYTLRDLDTNELKTVTVQEGIALVNENAFCSEAWQAYTRSDWLEGLEGLYSIVEIKEEV